MTQIQRVAVLGAGVMGAQLAAHFVNLDIPVLLYDLPLDQGAPNGRVLQAIRGLKKMSPPPLVEPERADLIEAANYDEHLPRLSTCDLVIEAIGEQLAWKQALYARILPHLAPQGWLVSNTSGLSLEELSTALPEDRQPRFCGMHFFNPPRYMALVELIPTARTDRDSIAILESFITTRLGKTVIHALDTPNFVANRIGVAATVFTFHQAQNFGLSCDLVDDLTGPLLGRPRSATYRTADLVGLDILSHVIHTTHTQVPDDPFRATVRRGREPNQSPVAMPYPPHWPRAPCTPGEGHSSGTGRDEWPTKTEPGGGHWHADWPVCAAAKRPDKPLPLPPPWPRWAHRNESWGPGEESSCLPCGKNQRRSWRPAPLRKSAPRGEGKGQTGRERDRPGPGYRSYG
nr:3-hydroxyacyl-CoA dehydrogenase family protein [Ferrovum sp.]